MSRSQRCVTSSRYSLNAFPQQPKETTITHLAMMPHEPDYLDVLRRLLAFEDQLTFDLAHVTEAFPFLLEQLLPGKMQLNLYGANQASIRQIIASWHSFPISYQGRMYGTLLVAPDPERPGKPLLPPPVVSLLKSLCGTMLALFEHQILLQGTATLPAHEKRPYEPLTQRQREVLTLMSQGYEEQAIAERMSITRSTVESHRQNIYTRLGVHMKHDAIRVAYQAHLFSPLDPLEEGSKSQKKRKPSGKKQHPPQST